MAGFALLDEIAKDLEQHENSTRIKKLIFCACHQRWENNLAVLDSFQLRDLIQNLVQSNTTLNELESCLNELAQNLSRPAEYTLIAKIILNKLDELYIPDEETTQIVGFKPHQAGNRSIIEYIAQDLEQNEHAIRIKKLILCLCQGKWENDVSSLNQYVLKDLLPTLKTNYPTLEQLKTSLSGIVDNLNRQELYSFIANQIINKVDEIYKNSEDSTQFISHQVPEQSTSDRLLIHEEYGESTAIKNQAKIGINNSNNTSTIKYNNLSLSKKKINNHNFKTSPDYDCFELRLEIMKYTNPLRVKVLVFSALYHPFNLTGQDWLIIKTHDLDNLLSRLFESCPTINELEPLLFQIAQYLDNPDESSQAASAIIQAMKTVGIG